MTVGVIFITHNAQNHLEKCLLPIFSSPLKPSVLVVNSSSEDGTVELAEALGAKAVVIPRRHFNHGATREWARSQLKTDIVVMMTPDAYALDGNMLSRLVEPIQNGRAVVSYARQIPHDGADFFESFPRQFNYPEQGQVRCLGDAVQYGVYTFFCSNTCAAYSNAALDEIGGFEPTLFGEDTRAVVKLLKAGHSIAYVAEAVVKHSHRYTLKQEFKRHFDIGLSRHALKCLLGKDSARGKAFACSMLKECPLHLLPYASLQIALKWIGYRIGQASVNSPRWWKRALSSQDFYWDSDFCK